MRFRKIHRHSQGNSRAFAGLAVNFTLATDPLDTLTDVSQTIGTGQSVTRRKAAPVVFDDELEMPFLSADGQVKFSGLRMTGNVGDGLFVGQKKIVSLLGVQRNFRQTRLHIETARDIEWLEELLSILTSVNRK